MCGADCVQLCLVGAVCASTCRDCQGGRIICENVRSHHGVLVLPCPTAAGHEGRSVDNAAHDIHYIAVPDAVPGHHRDSGAGVPASVHAAEAGRYSIQHADLSVWVDHIPVIPPGQDSRGRDSGAVARDHPDCHGVRDHIHRSQLIVSAQQESE